MYVGIKFLFINLTFTFSMRVFLYLDALRVDNFRLLTDTDLCRLERVSDTIEDFCRD